MAAPKCHISGRKKASGLPETFPATQLLERVELRPAPVENGHDDLLTFAGTVALLKTGLT